MTKFIKFFLLSLLLPFSVFSGHNKYFKAKKLEKEEKYKEACFYYAIAILNGSVFNEKLVRNRIKSLWNQYGPFNYESDLEEELKKPNVDTADEKAGHAAVISIIRESIQS